MHEADYFYDSPDGIDDTLEREVIHVSRKRIENNQPRNPSDGKNKPYQFAPSWKFRGNEDNIYYNPTLQVSPMTI